MASDQDQRKAMKLIYNEIVQINKKSVYDDEAHISIPDSDNPRVLEVSLTPRSGYYKGGEFKFKISLPDNYPNKAPTVNAITKMYHPNISYAGNVCLNILSSEFDPNYRLEHYINALLWLLLNPNFDSQLNGSVRRDTYPFDVVLAMRGFPVGGTTFERTMVSNENDNWEPSEDLKKSIFQCLWTGFNTKTPKGTILEFLKDPSTQEWIKYEPGLLRMESMGLDGFFVQKSNLPYVPQNAILKNSIWTVASKPVLVLTASYNNGQVSKELVAKFLEAKEEDLVPITSNAQSVCEMPEDKISIFSHWNKFDRILINDNVFIYETVVVPSWFSNVLFQIKSSIFKKFPDSQIGTFTTDNAGNTVASTSTVDTWYQTMSRTMTVQEFLNEPLVKDWIQYDPLTLFFTQHQITGDMLTRQSLTSVPDDVLAKMTLWTYGENVILAISAESETHEFSKDLLAKALGVPANVPEPANAESLVGCAVNRLVPFLLPSKINKVLVNEDLFTHEQITLPIGPSTYLSTSPAILKFIKEASIVPLTAPRTNLNFPKKALFQQWTQTAVQQPDKNNITVQDVLESQIARKWRNYDPTARYLAEVGALSFKFVSKEAEQLIPGDVIAKPVVYLADGKVVVLLHTERQDPSVELVAKALGLEQEKVAPAKDADYQNLVGFAKANFTIFYPIPGVSKMLVSETVMTHKFVITPITPTLSLQVPTVAFTTWKNTEVANICPPKVVQRKNVFNEWYTKYASSSIGEFLKTVHVADWGAYDPTTRMLQELQIDGKWRQKGALTLVPDEVYLRQYVFLVDNEPMVVIAAKTENSVVNKELVAKALGTTSDKINQVDMEWYISIGTFHEQFSVFNPLVKTRILLDDKVLQHKTILIESGHAPFFQIRSELLLKMPNTSAAPLTCEPNDLSVEHITDRAQYNALSKKQQRLRDKQPKKCLLTNWVDSLKNGNNRVSIEQLAQNATYAEFFDYEPTIALLLKYGVQGDFMKRPMDAQKISTRAQQCRLSTNQVLKELIWIADGKPILVISNGDDPVDEEFLARAVGASQLSRPKKTELEGLCGLPPQLVTAFSPLLKVDKIVVNQRILDLPEVATAAGKPELSLIIKPDAFTRLPNVVVAEIVNMQKIEELRIRREQEAQRARELQEQRAREAAANNDNNNNVQPTQPANANDTTQQPQQTDTNTNLTA